MEQQYRNAGIVVPFIDNEVTQTALFPPGSGLGAVDLYGFDAYPQRYGCAHPYIWPVNHFPTNYIQRFSQAPTDPHTIPEFQGGSPDGWGGVGYDNCALLTNGDFERIYYKNNFAAAITILNLYMTAGGTNWAHMSHPGGYVSYDYGSAITEERQVFREKYSEAKLLAGFMKRTPAYYTATPGNLTNGTISSTVDISVTPLYSNATTLYVVRHANFSSIESTSYTMKVSTGTTNVTIPQLGGSLTLNGRDSKIHVANYDVGGITMVYSSAEVFTWEKYLERTVLLLYGGANETHEAAFQAFLKSKLSIEGDAVTTQQVNGLLVVQWNVTEQRKVVHLLGLDVYLLWRNDAFNYWPLELEALSPISNYSSLSKSSIIFRAGYLMRTASISGTTLHLIGDLNSTTGLEVIGAPANITSVTFNGSPVTLTNTTASSTSLTASLPYQAPEISLPNLANLSWRYYDNLPEISSTYSDSAWPTASLTYTNNTVINNTVVPLRTPVSLYATDYGFSGGSILYRGHFASNGNETNLTLQTQGGTGFGHSVWLNETFLGSWPGSSVNASWTQNFTLPSNLSAGATYVFTVAIDHMGHDEDSAYQDDMKNPRGILNYTFADRSQGDIIWKITGNLHGEQYVDKTRGPLNEAAWFAERQGWHLPGAPTDREGWEDRSPIQGIEKAGLGFFVTELTLDMPTGYDVPLAFFFANATIQEPGSPNIWGGKSTNVTGSVSNYRAQIFVNGWQFGEYGRYFPSLGLLLPILWARVDNGLLRWVVNNLGPQHSFPVPQGILNYHGDNTLAVSLWAFDAGGAHIDDLRLVAGPAVQWGYPEPRLVDSPGWQVRDGAY